MARGKQAPKRPVIPDPLYNHTVLTRLINRIMKGGKKTLAQRLVYRALEKIRQKGEDPIKIFEIAIANVGPRVEVRPRRMGGASYQVPMEVRGDRRQSLAIRWIIEAAEKRPSKEYRTFDQKLAAELWDAAQNQGEAIKKRNIVIRMAEANRAFAHFRW